MPTTTTTVGTNATINLTGIAQQNKTLTIANPVAGNVYYWYRDDTLIKDEKGNAFKEPSYKLTQADVGTNITVSYKDGTHKTDPLRIANVNDQPTGTVKISGTPKQGSELQAEVNISDVDGIGKDEQGNNLYNYQWLRDGKNIVGGTKSIKKRSVLKSPTSIYKIHSKRF